MEDTINNRIAKALGHNPFPDGTMQTYVTSFTRESERIQMPNWSGDLHRAVELCLLFSDG